MSFAKAPALSSIWKVTTGDLAAFSKAIDIRDAPAFAAELEAFLQSRFTALTANATGETVAEYRVIKQRLVSKADGFRAAAPWVPDETAIQRGRAAMLQAYDRPHNLPLQRFAHLAGKVRQQIYKDIEARKLLALNVGRRGQRLPDWQLDPIGLRLTQAVLQAAPDIDSWTVYHALSEPLEGLVDRRPVDAATRDNVDAIASAVLNALGVH